MAALLSHSFSHEVAVRWWWGLQPSEGSTRLHVDTPGDSHAGLFPVEAGCCWKLSKPVIRRPFWHGFLRGGRLCLMAGLPPEQASQEKKAEVARPVETQPEKSLSNTAVSSSVSDSVVSQSLQPHSLTRILCPWDSSGKNTGVGSHSLLQGIFPNQKLNFGLLHRRQILYHLSHKMTNLPFDRFKLNWSKSSPAHPG